MLAMGRLPHQLFPPSRLGTVVTEIAAELPSGWTLTTPLHSGNLWHLYDQISVTTAVTSTGLRIFATLPVVETRWTFVLFRVVALKRYILNDKRYTAAHWADLPQFLAVAPDRQAFVELSAEDVQPCHRLKARVCQLPRAVTKKASHQSCVAALFFNRTKSGLSSG